MDLVGKIGGLDWRRWDEVSMVDGENVWCVANGC